LATLNPCRYCDNRLNLVQKRHSCININSKVLAFFDPFWFLITNQVVERDFLHASATSLANFQGRKIRSISSTSSMKNKGQICDGGTAFEETMLRIRDP
jgi:hypothetical protein